MSQAKLPVPEPETTISKEAEREIIFTVNGSAKAAERVYRNGALIGVKSNNRPPPDHIPVDFVDWPWDKLPELGGNVDVVFEDHVRVVADHEPKYAVAPDVMGDLRLPAALEYADELKRYAETVIVVPKSAHPSAVPSEFRVGMPCQDRYGPPPWQWLEYEEASEVHCLGGSPVDHHRTLKYNVPVESVDTSLPIKPCKFVEYFSASRKKWTPSDLGFYECLGRTYRNMRLTMNPDRRVQSTRYRNRRLDYEATFAESEEADCWGPGEKVPFPGRGYYRETEL